MKGWKQIFQANGQEKKAGEAVLISDKIDFKKRAIKRDPDGHFIILKGRIHQEDINIVNTYAPNIGAPKYIDLTDKIQPFIPKKQNTHSFQMHIEHFQR